MEKCFITKLPSSVDNDGIVRLGEIPIYFDVDESPSDKSRSFTISMFNQPERTLRIYNGYFTDKTLTQNLGTTLTLPATGVGNVKQTFYVSNTKCTVFIPIRYTSNLDISGQIHADSDFVPNTKYIDLEDIRYTNASGIMLNNSSKLDWDIAKVAKYFPNINNFRVSSTNCFGDISTFSNVTNLAFLFLNNTNVSGNISGLSNLGELQHVYLGNTNVSGDISALSNLTELWTLNSGNTNISGNISGLSNLVNLITLALGGTNVTGDISALSNLVNLRALYLNFTQVSGDISALSNLTNISSLNLSNTNVNGDISALSNLVNLVTLDISRTNVTGDISVVIDNMTKLKTLYINTKITATNAQIKTLQDRGVTVIRN